MDFIDDSDEEDGCFNRSEPLEIEGAKSLLTKRPESCGVMQFHNGIEEAMILYVGRTVTDRSPDKVIKAVDEYCYGRHWMMHIGDEKGAVIDGVIDTAQLNNPNPLFVVEIGSYCGYSAVRMASRFINVASKVFCIEREPKCVKWTGQLAELAGLTDSVIVIEGEVPTGIDRLKQVIDTNIDVLLIDHDKSLYLSDLILFEQSGLLKVPGAVVVADNVLSFGCPLNDYLQHVRTRDDSNSVVYGSSTLHKSSVEYSCVNPADLAAGDYLEDGVEVSVIVGSQSTDR